MSDLQPIKDRLAAATPGPWERPLRVRSRSYVQADMPKGDPSSRWKDQTDHEGNPEKVAIVSCPTWSDSKFVRKQSGRDLEFIAHAPTDIAKLVATVEAVLALHEPFEWSFGQGPVRSCRECADGGMSEQEAEYPCATVRAIEQALA